MVILIEILVLCVVFTLMVCIMAKNPIATLFNYPPKIQERVKSLPEYKDKIPTTKNMVFTKLLAATVMVIIISLILRYINGYTTFMEALVNSYLIWTVVNIYDVIVMDILWFCQDKRFVFKGTEDMVDEYHNYWFHIKGGIIGQVIGAVVCVVVGLVIHFIL